MFKIMLAAHLLTAVFAIGPLAHAAVTAARGVRAGAAGPVNSAARTLRVYSIASVLVVLFGFALMSANRPGTSTAVAALTDTYIWLSLLLWLAAMGVLHAVLAPTLRTVSQKIAAQDSVVTLTVRVALAGAVVAVLFTAIIVVMVYQPGA